MHSAPKKAAFIAVMEDVLEVYSRPYDPQGLVVCMDEKPFQLFGEICVPITAKTGKVEKVDHEYIREGTCSIFIFTGPLASWQYTQAFEQKTKKDWTYRAKCVLDNQYSDTKKLHL